MRLSPGIFREGVGTKKSASHGIASCQGNINLELLAGALLPGEGRLPEGKEHRKKEQS